MGHTHSSGAGAATTTSSTPGGRVIVDPSAVSPAFIVEPMRRLHGVPSTLILRVDAEALTIAHPLSDVSCV